MNIELEKLIGVILEYNPSSDIKLIEKAYNYAHKSSHGLKDITWSPLVWQLTQTALNLTNLEAPDILIVAGLLHKVTEKSKNISSWEIKNLFGDEIADLVSKVNRLSNIKYTWDENEQWIELLKRSIMSKFSDLWVIYIKMCSRIYEVNYLEKIDKKERQRIANETLILYVPIIHLLSIGHYYWTIEDECFKYSNPKEYQNIIKKIWKKYDYFKNKVQDIEESIKKEINSNEIQAEITSRIKSIYSIYNKIKNKDILTESISDILALRITTENNSDCYRILGIIHKLYIAKFDKFKDYISSPKPNWYQRIHTTVLDHEWDMIEFQIQTIEMWNLNKCGIAAHFVYKNAHSSFEKTPTWTKKILEIQKNDKWLDLLGYLKNEILTSPLYCYTPKWQKINLPKDATILDFAYKIHTDLWDKFKFAYVNGIKIENPVHILKSWDIVSIVKSLISNSDYKVSYLKTIKTNKAQDNLKKLFRRESKEKRINLWRFIINDNLNFLWLKPFDELTYKIQNQILHKFKIKTNDDLLYEIWTWFIDFNRVIAYISTIYKTKNKLKIIILRFSLKTKDLRAELPIVEVFNNLNTKIINLNYYNEEYIDITCEIDSVSHLQNILAELKRLPNVKQISRIFPKKLIVVYVVIILIWALLLSNPLFINYLNELTYNNNLNIINKFLWISTFIISFSIMIFSIYFFKHMATITLKRILDFKIFWIFMFTLNTIILWSTIWESIYINNYFNWMIFFSLWVVTYAILGYEYINYKLEN